ncbi:MAG: DUF2268 domain-containing putative Zn-dependent protease [Flavobacteriales bacterium]
MRPLLAYKIPSTLLSVVAIVMMSCTGDDPPGKRTKGAFPTDPTQAQLIGSDVDLFWRAFDELLADTSKNPLQSEYLDKGTDGLRDFIADERIKSAEALKELVLMEADYYRRIRPSSERYLQYEEPIRDSYRKLKDLYPDAVFPPVYFVIGRTTSGGTASKHGLIIGMEIMSSTPDTTAYGRPTLPLDDIPYIVAHEIIHFLQVDDTTDQSLLAHCMREGTADLIAELTAGERVKALNGDDVYPYGERHMTELLQEFSTRASSDDLSGWLYSSAPGGRPQNLGYWMGYRIAKHYYDQAADKHKAIHELLHIPNYREFVDRSGFFEQVKSAR